MAEGEHKTRTVESRFTVNDQFSGVFGRIESKVGEGAKKFQELREKFRDFRREQGLTTLGALGLGYGIGSWIEKTREANAEFGRLQKQTAGVLAGALKFEKGAGEVDRYTRSLALAKDVMEDQERVAGRFNVSLDDVTQTYRTLAVGAGQLGATQEQVQRLTEDAIASQKRFGGAGDEAAKIILRGLQTGRIRAVDPFSASIANAVGNMTKLTRAQRFEHIQRALAGSRQIADQMSTGIDASLNRARMTVDGLLRDATGPLFKEIANSLDHWAKHLRDVRENGKPLVDIFAGRLVSAFHTLEKVSAFIKEHWVQIAAVNVGTKLAGNAERIAAMFGGRRGGGEGVEGVSKGLSGMVTGLGGAIAGLAAFKGALDLGVAYLDKRTDDRNRELLAAQQAVMSSNNLKRLLDKSDGLGFTNQQERLARAEAAKLHHAGVVDEQGRLDRQALAFRISNLEDTQKADLQRQFGIKNPMSSNDLNTRIANALGDQMEGILNQLRGPMVTAAKRDDKNLPFAKGNTIINGGVSVRINTEDADPDAIFVRFQQKLHDSITHRGQAVNAEPAGL